MSPIALTIICAIVDAAARVRDVNGLLEQRVERAFR